MTLTNRDILEHVHRYPGCTRTAILAVFVAPGARARGVDTIRAEMVRRGLLTTRRLRSGDLGHWPAVPLPTTPRLAGPRKAKVCGWCGDTCCGCAAARGAA